jgi:hypothetical protein
LTALRSIRWGLTETAAKAVLAEMDEGDGRLAVTPQRCNGMSAPLMSSKEYEAYQRARQDGCE